MKSVPALNARQVIKALKRLGFEEDRQKGGHLILYNPHTKRRTVIPVHSGHTIKKPLLKAIIEQDAGVTIEEFLENI